MFNNNMPLWFNIWWLINIGIMIAFFAYWISVEFEISPIVYVFIIYANGWGFWARWFKKKRANLAP